MRGRRRIVARGAVAALLLLAAACASTPPRGGPILDTPPPSRAETASRNAAQRNEESLRTLAWSPFGRPETGWETYLPITAAEIGAAPVAAGAPFAEALAAWQRARGLPADGVFTPETFNRLKTDLQNRRPFLRARAGGGPCPDPPDEATLAWTTPAESWGARPNAMRPGTLAAWRRMRAAAKAEGALESALSLQVFSGYRSPAHDAERCAIDGNCDGLRRAVCSAHRTGLTLDLVLDGARPVDSTADADRLRLSRSPAYRWLVVNARRFGFVNYPFEPWHWEWTGEAP